MDEYDDYDNAITAEDCWQGTIPLAPAVDGGDGMSLTCAPSNHRFLR